MFGFGGDAKKAHFCVSYERAPYSMELKERRALNRERFAAAKEAGIKEQRYAYTIGDNKGKAQAKAYADKYAAHQRRTYPNIPFEVVEGSFL